MKKIGIYIHIPFCRKKCKYCDFTSFDNCNEYIEEYMNALIKSIKYSKYENLNVDTIYFGGGTPSIVDENFIVQVLETINNKFNVLKDAEITIEVNPGTVTQEKLQTYFDVGFNRLSIGLQSTYNSLLYNIGRIHTYEQFEECFKIARDIGFNNINIDLMLALPEQTLERLENSVNRIIKLNPEHISLYSLILEDGTVLKKEVEEGILELPSEESERKMYHLSKNILEENGYKHYEISNFSKNGYESKHNLNCWNQEEYIGFGLASHSYFEGKRFSNIDDLKKYLKNIEEDNFEKNIIINEVQTAEEKMKEYMMLGFRKLEGISISKFEQKFGIHPLFYFRFELSKLEDDLSIEVDLDDIRITNRGLDFANKIFEEFV